MARRKTLVIDTDVLRSSGEHGDVTGRALMCSRFLEGVVEHRHSVAVTEAIFAEWKKHRSRFALRWLRIMFGKKRVRFVTAVHVDLEKHVDDVFAAMSKRKAVLKDRHLVEAALAAAKAVVSMDENARSLFRACAGVKELSTLKTIVWINPAIINEEGLRWLELGAPAEHHRMLGA